MPSVWNVAQYERYRGERGRPFLDLLGRVNAGSVGRAVDLGSGTGELTALLLERWPSAHVLGVDSSEAMLAAARPRSVPGKLEFVAGDASTWRPDAPCDLIFSNALLQWVPDHDALIPRLAGALASGGTLAVQMPGNFDAPSHVILDQVLVDRGLTHLRRTPPVKPVSWYAETLLGLGMTVDAWETTYMHVLHGEDPVLEWVKGTALTPILGNLDGDAKAGFLADYSARLRDAYPRGAQGKTLFPFRRIFFVAVAA
jgi:trans-aconitate 2-methyltransferase